MRTRGVGDRINDHGAEYWSARDLQAVLGYSQWRRFEDAIKRGMTSSDQSGNPAGHHFAGAGKMIELGKGGVRKVEDFHLSRFACYLIAQNGDPRKTEIAQAQKYFALQTRRQEMTDQLAADVERLELRRQASEEFKALSGAAPPLVPTTSRMPLKSIYRNDALILSSIALPGHNSLTPMRLNAVIEVLRWACKSSGSGSMYNNPVVTSPLA